MSILIRFTDTNGRQGTFQEWHIQHANPSFDVITGTDWVQVDGHELQYVQLRFPTLPMPKMLTAEERSILPDSSSKRLTAGFPLVVTWFGDTAKFILANL